MEDHEIHQAFHGDFSGEMLVAGLGDPSQLISREGSFNNSYNKLLSSESDEFCPFSDNVVFHEKVVDNCDWIDEMIENIPFPPNRFGGGGSSIPSFQTNCSWTYHRFFQPTKEKDAQMSSSTNSSITTASDSSERSPKAFSRDVLYVEGKPGLYHLIKAIGEAKQDGSLDLVDVISKRILEIVSPLGTAVERMGYYMFQSSESQYDYIWQESMKIGKVVFQAFSTLCLYNLFPIFTANVTILSSIPEGVETVHIFDFDMREGSQWPPFLEAIGSTKLVRITSLRWSTDYTCDHSCSKYEETKKNLLEYAKSKGLRLLIDEMGIEEIHLEKKRRKNSGGNEFLVFNCVVRFPHIGPKRTLSQAVDFLKVSKEIIESSFNGKGIITFSDASVGGIGAKKRYDFASYLDECLLHSRALFESTEWHIPLHQIEARTAIECLFLGPLISSNASLTKWEEIKEACHDFPSGLHEQKLSKEVLTLAMEMVKGQGLYEAKLDGSNELKFEWEGTPLVRFSAWR